MRNSKRLGIVIPEGAKVLMTQVPGEPTPGAAGGSRRGRYTRREPGRMNQLEARYEAHLGTLKACGSIHDFAFEPEKFRLANHGDACYFTPDFRVLMVDGTVEFHDTKGHMEEDALIKIKWFVQQHPYPLVVVRWSGGDWRYERYEP